MWHSTHHVLSLAVLNHCPFNTELTTRNHPRIRDPTNRFERLSIITRWHDDCFVLFVVVSRPHQTQHVACRPSDCRLVALLAVGCQTGGCQRNLRWQIERLSIITRWHDDCFVLFVVVSRPHQTQHVACRHPTVDYPTALVSAHCQGCQTNLRWQIDASKAIAMRCFRLVWLKYLQDILQYEKHQTKATHRYRYHFTAL